VSAWHPVTSAVVGETPTNSEGLFLFWGLPEGEWRTTAQQGSERVEVATSLQANAPRELHLTLARVEP
jgi:hypothetical protein